MAQPQPKPATYEDLLDLPEHIVGEIIDGELITHPRPAPKHLLAAGRIAGEIDLPFGRGKGGPGGWIILIEPEMHLNNQIMVPDLAGWRHDSMAELPQELSYFDIPPDWLCEVLSPSTARLDRTRKMELYAQFGTDHLWLVDPAIQTVEVYRLRDNQWTLIATHAGDDPARLEPFDAIEFELGALWSP